jgi:hypothetical protein
MEFQYVLVMLLTALILGIVAVCVYVILTLKDLRVTIQKANTAIDDFDTTLNKTNLILNDVEKVTSAVSNPASTVTSLIGVFRAFKPSKPAEKQV